MRRDHEAVQLPVPMAPLSPVRTVHLFEELDTKLIELLESLAPAEWQQPTIVPGWTVKQVAAHLLDTPLRRLSFARDGTRPVGPEIRDERELAAYVNDLNARGVQVYGSLSSRVLISLMRVTLPELRHYFAGLEPEAPAVFAVSWAGDRVSPNWFDIAREFTERWHHQQQIRLAVDRPGIAVPHLFAPVLDCFMRGLPRAYREISAAVGTVAHVRIEGPSGGDWFLQRDQHEWVLSRSPQSGSVAAMTAIPEDVAWRIFTKGIDRAAARAYCTISGDDEIATGVLRLTAIVA